MPTSNTISIQKLSGRAIGELKILIADAFPLRGDLEMHVKENMDTELYGEITQSDKSMHLQVFNLLEWAESRGLTTKLLQTILQRKGGTREELRKAIYTYCPELDPLLVGVKTLQVEFEQNSAVRNVIIASREKLKQLHKDITVLSSFKTLHDCLHTIQLYHYYDVIMLGKQLEINPLAPDMLISQHVNYLEEICSRAREAVESLPEKGAGRAHLMREVVEQLDSATAKLRAAIRNLDNHGATTAFSSVRYVIEAEQARLSSRLNEIAEELPLNELDEVIEKVIAAMSADNASKPKLQEAVASLRDQESELNRLVAEHDKWQKIEKDFWEEEDNIERKTPESIEAFKERWPTIKLNVDSLACREPQSEWAKKTKEKADLVDKLITGQVDSVMANFNEFRGHFIYFRENALHHFFQVNRALKARCKQILRIAEPLENLNEKVDVHAA